MVDKVEDVPGASAQPDVHMSDIAAQPIIDAFGGIRPMAAKLGVPVSTVQGWKQRDTIPAGRIEAIVGAAQEHAVTLPDLTAKAPSQPSEPGEAEPAAKAEPPTTDHRPAGPRPAMRFSPPQQSDAQDESSPAAAQTEPREAAAPRREPEHVPETSPTSATSTSSPTGAPASTMPPPAPDSSGAGRGAGGALFLAIIALVVAALWPILFSQWFGADAQDGGESTGQLEQRVTALEQAPAADTADLQQAVDALRAEVDGLAGGQDGAGAEGLQALSDRLDALEQAGTADSAPPAEITQALDSLQQAMDQLDQMVGSLQDRVGSIEDQIAQLEAGGGGPTTDELQQALASVQAAVDQIQGNLDDVSQAAASARQQAVAEASTLVDQAVARLSSQIAAVAGTDDAAAEHQAFLLALGQLASRLRTADAFADELAALRQVVASSESLSASLGDAVDQGFAPLDDAAAAGVPTLAGLQASFDGMRRAVLNATDAAPEDTLDEVWGEISSMVTVSRVDGAEAGSVDGVLAAAESHLASGDLAAAVTSLEGLGAIGSGYADAAAAWIAGAKLRLAADQAIESVYQAALASFRPEPTSDAEPEPSGDSE